jgi:hypothetical protein
VGFAGKLVLRADSHESGYAMLDRYLPEVRVYPDSSDFIYRINRKKASDAAPGILLNRLATWSFLRIVLRMRGELVGVPDSLTQHDEQSAYACSVDFDINTPAEFKEPLPHDRLPQLLAEMARHATDIAALGDIR